jgi:hypothetical protein
LFLITGCSTTVETQWFPRPDKTTQDFHRDSYVCMQESRYGANSYGPFYDISLYRSCMLASRWQPAN